MLGPICVFHCVTILGTLSRACLMELLVGVFGYIPLFLPSILSIPSALLVPCPAPHLTLLCACLRQSQAQNSFKFNSNVTFCIIFFFFSFCVGIFGVFEKCRKAARGGTARGCGEGRRGLKNTVTERLNRFGFEGGFEFFPPLQSSFVCLFCFPARAQTVVYVVVSVLVVTVAVAVCVLC